MPTGLKRYQASGTLHFITFSCYQRQPQLQARCAPVLFLWALEQARAHYDFVVGGYVVMPEHVHLLVSEPERRMLATALKAVKQSVARRLAAPGGHLWQARYYDFNVLTHGKYVEKLRYMHRNPVKRGLVERPEDWRWSSYRYYLTGEEGIVKIDSPWTARRRDGTKVLTERSIQVESSPQSGCPVRP